MTREKIKEVAQRLFAELGYEAASLSAIAAEVGIKTPSIYAHFVSKEALLLEVWSDLVEDYRRFMEGVIGENSDQPVPEQLGRIVLAYGQYFLEDKVRFNLWCRLMTFPPPEFKERVQSDTMGVEEQILNRIQQLIALGIDKGEVEPVSVDKLTQAMLLLKEGYVMWLIYWAPYYPSTNPAELWNLLWHGMARTSLK